MSEKLNIDEQIAQIDASIEVQKNHIKRAEYLEELFKDEKFQFVFVEGYLTEEANRVFNLLTSPRVTKSEEIDSYKSQLDTIKNVARYFGDGDYLGTVAILGMNAKKALEADMKLKQELLESSKEA